MKGLNRAYLIGHIGQTPVLRTTPSGTDVLQVSLATPNVRKVNDEWVDTPDWHRLTAFGGDAKFLASHAKQGDALAVECAIRPNKWTDKDNVVHHEVKLVIERVAWLGSKNRSQPSPEGSPAPSPRSHAEASDPDRRLDDDDIPR